MGHEITSLEARHEGWSSYYVAHVRLPDGAEVKREIEDHGLAVGVLPYDPDRRVAMLIRQFRVAAFFAARVDSLLECPAGLLEEDDPAEGIRREALEEVGLRLGTLEPVATVWTMPGVSTERMHLFLAPYNADDRVGEGGGLADEHENIVVEEIPLSELAALADAGRVDDMKTFCLVQCLRVRRPELFR